MKKVTIIFGELCMKVARRKKSVGVCCVCFRDDAELKRIVFAHERTFNPVSTMRAQI